MSKVPPPGSQAAAKAGCTCPVLDNAYGRGHYCVAGLFVFTEGCPVHAERKHDGEHSDHSR